MLLAGWSGGNETQAPPLSAWLIRRTSEALDPKWSWPGSLVLQEEVASCWAWASSILPTPQGRLALVCLSAESVQVWGDCKQQKSWCVSRGSVASLETTSKPPSSPAQLVQTGCLMKPERRRRELCPSLTSPPSWAIGGALTLPCWTKNAQWLGRWL